MNGPILVLGGEGMLGHKMFQVLRGRFPDTMCTVRQGLNEGLVSRVDLFHRGGVIEQVDVLEHDEFQETLRALRPGWIVNCVGIIKQRAAATDPIPSIAINALLPHQLAATLDEWGGRLIHFSTDCVFSGKRGGYTEQDPSDAEDLYGRTKYLGEVHRANALTLRTSIIGRELAEHRSLLDWFLAQRGRRIRGYTRVLYSGVTTNYLAGLVADLVERFPRLTGLFQVTGETITKHDLLLRLRSAYELDVEVAADAEVASDRSMVGDKFQAATGFASPGWDRLVRELAADSTPYHEWMTDETV